MSEITDAEVGEIDLAVVAYRDEGDWNVAELPDRSLDAVDAIARELRRYPGENGALALISVAEDFVLLVRAQGSLVRVLLSDATAATDWTLARSAVDHIGVHVDDEDDQAPAGDLGIVADMGMSAKDMGALLDDFDLYPEEILSEIADSVGFGEQVRPARRSRRVSDWDAADAAGPGRWRARRRRQRRRAHRCASSSDPSVRWSAPGSNVRERDADPTGHAEVVALRAAAAARRRVAAGRLHPGGHPRALHDVRRRGGPGPARPPRLRCVRREGRRRRLPLGRGPRPPAEPPPRGPSGVLADESTALLDAFFRHHRP